MAKIHGKDSPILFGGTDSNWEGAPDGYEHRTVGPHRAWCLNCHEWCYPGDLGWCDCCYEVSGYEKTWVKRKAE